jgi:murein DD-endopeptidase MepM/ murein hydrolase activator NlpD
MRPGQYLWLLPVLLLCACQAGTASPVSPSPELLQLPATQAAQALAPETLAAYPAYLALVSKPGVQGGEALGAPTAGEPEGVETPAAVLEAQPPTAIDFPASEVVYGPSQLDFDPAAYLKQAGGALGRHREYLASSGWTSAADILQRVALENSISPRLLLGLLEYQCRCVLGQELKALESGYALGVEDYHWKGLYGQLWWAANQLSAGYYGWSEGWLKELRLPDNSRLAFAPGALPGSTALQTYFAHLWSAQDQSAKIGPETWRALHPEAFGQVEWEAALDPQAGFLAFYRRMFGEFSQRAAQVEPLVPPGLRQPELQLPFEPGRLWSFTSGPHKAWEREGSLAALDFAPASEKTGCLETDAWVTAVGTGKIVRVGKGLVVQDLDGAAPSDGLEQTGWAILYMHIAEQDRARLGAWLKAGERIGRPSCEGGPATGTHLHLARKYNGVWIAAGGKIPFIMDGWKVQAGSKPYTGWLVKEGETVLAQPYASYLTHIRRPGPAVPEQQPLDSDLEP